MMFCQYPDINSRWQQMIVSVNNPKAFQPLRH